MGSNPALVNYPKYDIKKQCLDPFYLNGLKVSFSQVKESTKFKVKIEYKKTTLDNNVRWTGNIVLPDITGDFLPDLQLGFRKTLTLDKSGTANRHTKTMEGDFINPTKLTVKSGAAVVLKKNSKIVVQNNSTLEFEKSTSLTLERNARIIIQPGAILILNGIKPQLAKKAKILIK